MKRTTGSRRLVLLVMIELMSMVACGVPLQSTAEPIPSGVLPDGPVGSAPTGPSSTSAVSPTLDRLRLWFVKGDGLVAALSSLPSGTGAERILLALADGPAGPAGSDLRTVARDPLTGRALVGLPGGMESPGGAMAGSTVTVEVSPAFGAMPSREQVLLLAQVVLSLTGAGAESVAVVDESGAPVALPLPDGRLLDAPARARDYAPLITRP